MNINPDPNSEFKTNSAKFSPCLESKIPVQTTYISSALATLHCLIGCTIGEIAGLLIGVSLGIGVWPTISLAVILAYISGFSLSLVPLMKREGLNLKEAMKVIWLGEAISIMVMEIAMNRYGSRCWRDTS